MSESCIDFGQSLAGLLCDPIFYGFNAPKGNGHPVLLIPGFFAGDWLLTTMSLWLSRIGYRSYLSGIDWNVGCPSEKLERLDWRLSDSERECGARAVLIGDSLGGVLARAPAIVYPHRVRHVVTLGSPARIVWNAVRPRYRSAVRAFQTMWHCASVSSSAVRYRYMLVPVRRGGEFSLPARGRSEFALYA
jgi:pimeloyl-ACP methyl ester carboxylesterase